MKLTVSFIPMALLVLALSVAVPDDAVLQFFHPALPGVVLQLRSDQFPQGFRDRIEGGDQIYHGSTRDAIECTVHIHKLGTGEVTQDSAFTPANALAAFPVPKRLSRFATGEETWASPEFIYKQFDVKDAGGVKANQKHFYGWAQMDSTVLVSIHLSKAQSIAEDSLKMRTMLESFTIKK